MMKKPCESCPFLANTEAARRQVGAHLLDLRQATRRITEALSLAEVAYGQIGDATSRLVSSSTPDPL